MRRFIGGGKLEKTIPCCSKSSLSAARAATGVDASPPNLFPSVLTCQALKQYVRNGPSSPENTHLSRKCCGSTSSSPTLLAARSTRGVPLCPQVSRGSYLPTSSSPLERSVCRTAHLESRDDLRGARLCSQPSSSSCSLYSAFVSLKGITSERI
jgi:hypothetical protein